MSFFNDFPIIDYRFGNEANPDKFRNIAVYAEILDQVKKRSEFYEKYYIGGEERPDQVSFKLYKTPNLAWTFFHLNDHLRERGWPLTNRQVLEYAQKIYPYVTITTQDTLYDKFKIGQRVQGSVSGTTGTISHRHLDMGQVAIADADGLFIPGEKVTSYTIVDTPLKPINTIENITVVSNGEEYLAAKFYKDADGNILDRNPTQPVPSFATEVTYFDHLSEKNDELKSINILRPESLNSVVRAFKQAIIS